MNRPSNSSSACTEAFSALGRSVVGLCDAHRAGGADLAPPYKRGSLAWLDRTRERRYVNDGWTSTVRNLHAEAIGYFARAEDHLRGAGILIAAPRIFSSPATVARTVLVAVSAGSWLLDPEVETLERIRRYLTVEMRVRAERLTLAEKAGETYPRAEQELEGLKQIALQNGLEPKTSKKGWPYVGEPHPSDTELMRQFDRRTGAVVDPELLQTFLSWSVHANPNSMALAKLTPASSGRHHDGVRSTMISLSLGQVAALVLPAAHTFYRGTIEMYGYFGLSAESFEQDALPHLQSVASAAAQR
ncbi:hypothetical protein SCD75_02905 [Prescottella equi]|nr:hypothetical protein SCD75_00570 [Prescottella equi]WQB74492.1 hypothetical protein SCD75_02905 [Prescottella equi]